MPPRTILQIVPELDTGGAELSAVEIGEAVHRAGWRSIIATEGGRLEADAEAQGSEIHKLSVATKNPIKMWANVRRIVQLCQRENVSLIHARSRAPAWSALWAARRSGLPFVTTYHGAYNENGSAKRLYNSVMARGDRVIANSQFTADLIRQR
ncbi:MAG: glycosyltransferase, partial [Pseudomonadota bacterium]